MLQIWLRFTADIGNGGSMAVSEGGCTRSKCRRGALTLGLAWFGVLFCAQAQAGLNFIVCTEDQPALPLTNPPPGKPAAGQILIAMTASNTGAKIQNIFAFWKECQQRIDKGSAQALNVAGYAAINISIAAFPMAGTVADTRRSLGVIRTDLFRRIGSPADMIDGQFVNLKTPVGILHAYQINSISVARHGGTVDDNSRTMNSLAQRLAAGRLDLVAAGAAMHELIAQHYPDQLQALAEPLDEAHYYLAFSQAFYAQHKAEVETFWDEMARVKASPEYLAKIAP